MLHLIKNIFSFDEIDKNMIPSMEEITGDKNIGSDGKGNEPGCI